MRLESLSAPKIPLFLTSEALTICPGFKLQRHPGKRALEVPSEYINK
jgi:hypothetical protein